MMYNRFHLGCRITLFTAAIGFSFSAQAWGQTGGSSASSLGSIGTSGGGGGSSMGGGSSAAGGGSGGSSGAGGGAGGLQSSPFRSAGGAGGGAGGTSGSTVDQTDFLSSTFSNPLYEGRPNQTINNSASASGTGTTAAQSTPGGFGQSSFGTSNSGSTTTRGTGTGSSITPGAPPASTTRIAYSTVLKFPVAPVVSSQLQANLNDIIHRSSSIMNPANINVEVRDNRVVLRGLVANDDERRLVEGMIRLTPGVRVVENALITP